MYSERYPSLVTCPGGVIAPPRVEISIFPAMAAHCVAMLSYVPVYNRPVRPKNVHFSILSPEEIRKMSVVQVTNTTLYYRGIPNSGGLNDALMGTCDRRLLCGTCMQDIKLCQGHVGSMELPYPMYHIGFFDTVLKILRSVCFHCSRICANEEELHNIDLDGKPRFNLVYNLVKSRKKCPHCGMVKPSYTKGSLSIRIDWPTDTPWEDDDERLYCNRIFTAREALSILTHVPDEDYKTMGFDPVKSNPKNMIQTVIVVPPPVTRPAISQSEGSRSRGQNDLTHKLQDIKKKCVELEPYIQNWRTIAMTPDLHERISRLQFEVFTLVNNSIKGQKQSTQRSGAPTKSLIDRLKGKDGRIRGNLMGKRVDFSARSVITPCPNMDIDNVGVPEKLALTLTISERVTAYNIDTLRKRVKIGAGNVKGADSIMCADGSTFQLMHCKDRAQLILKEGDVVERYLQDNDIVVFNRQPSLHRMSMLGHRVKIMPGLTFRLNVVCTSPYNADFDGDEMNLHVPRSQSSIADVTALMMVGNQIISPQSNKPCMGIVQDSLLGGHLLCEDATFLDHYHACLVCGTLKYTSKRLPAPCIRIRGVAYWSGKQLLALLLPTSMVLDFATIRTITDDLDQVVIRSGRLLTGIVTKSVLGAASGGIIDVLCRDYGNATATNFMSDVQRVTNNYLLQRGFSVGISDCILNAEGHQKVTDRLDKATRLCEEISKAIQEGDEVTEEVAQNAESTILRILSKTLMQTGSIVNDYMKNNAIKTMVECKSKGTPINLSQIMGLVGQQSVEGRRINPEKGSRTLSCFGYNEKTLASQGFVHNSYSLGLLPSEFFYHAMGGREGLVDTSVKTSVTGYLQRRQVKSMEDHKVHHDGTVRDALDEIVDFYYGSDGMDPVRLERVKLPLLQENTAVIRHRMTEREYAIAMDLRRKLLTTRLGVNMPELDVRVLLPFHPVRLRHHVRDSATPIGRERAEEELLKTIGSCRHATINAALVDNFCSSRMAKVDETDFYALFEKIRTRIDGGTVQPAEMVGSIAAQSVGEPATQMSIRGDEHVLVRDRYGVRSMEIQQVIDPLMQAGRPPDMQVMGVSPQGIVSWADVLAVSRHPANGPMLKVTTSRGKTVVATASHSFLTRSVLGTVVPIRGDMLKVGDVTPILSVLPPDEEDARRLGASAETLLPSNKCSDPYFLEWLTNTRDRSLAFLQGLAETSTSGDILVNESHARIVFYVCHFCAIRFTYVPYGAQTKITLDTDLVRKWKEQIYWDAIVRIDHLGNSDETVYDFTVQEDLQSFMLTNGLFVHNTLNSVDYETNMAIHWTANYPPPAPHDAAVGAFIDALIQDNQDQVQIQPDGVTVYLPLPPGTAVALSPDEDGNMMWTELEAVTRHPPINKDGSNTLCKITTESGREVIVTKGKSLLVERDGKLVDIEGDRVEIGDRVPIVNELPSAENCEFLNLHAVFKETEVVFSDTMIEAMEATKHDRHWFLKGGFAGRSCYSRSDIMREAMKHRPALLQPGLATWPHGGAMFPMKIPLDRNFGFFMGAYLAEGCLTEHQVHISNNDPDFQNAAKVWPESMGIKSHIPSEKHQKKDNGTSISVMFHSTMLSQLLERTCGKTSYGKRVPSFAFAGPSAFVEGLLDGYFSGDGTVANSKHRGTFISASSRSKELIDGISLLLTRYKIYSTISVSYQHCHVDWKTEENGHRTQTKYGEKKPLYRVNINRQESMKYKDKLTFTLNYKQERLDNIEDTIGNQKMHFVEKLKDVHLDPIVCINETPSSKEFVYDLTVAKTRNMTATNGLCHKDTFHFSGVGNKNVTLGIPRLAELLNVSKNPKTPSTTIRFLRPFNQDLEFVTYFANTLPLARLGDIVSKCDIIYDPDPYHTVVPDDEYMVSIANKLAPDTNNQSSNCITRLQLNCSVMKMRHLTPPIVRRLLQRRLENRATVISSETNALTWVIRIRFSRVMEMMERVGLSDREAVLCHRVMSTLLETMVLSGHPNVKTASVIELPREYLDENENIVKEKEYAVSTLGDCLIDCAASPCVDWGRTTTNDITQMIDILGIEATAAQLFEQLHTVVSFDGTYIDPRHLTMLVNTMCRSGTLMALNRHGINRSDTGPLGKCSFEETPDVLCDAAMYAESDNGRGVSTAIMTGQLARIGSGNTDILFNMDCMNSRNIICEQEKHGRKKPWRSTCRSFTAAIDSEVVEYSCQPVNSSVLASGSTQPFFEDVTTAVEQQNMIDEDVQKPKRMRFRPTSPSTF